MEILKTLIEFVIENPVWSLILIGIMSFVIVAEFKNRGPGRGK